MNNFKILCLTTTLTCASCSVGPNFKLPEVLMPSKWKNGGNASTADIPVPGEWWKLFGSDELNRLEARALENNQELRGALARVETARALVGTQQADWFPQLNMKNGMNYERLSQSSFGANLPPGVALPKTQRRRFQNLLELGWEFDLWGRVRRGVESSKASQFAAMETLSARRLTLAAEVARLYFLTHSLDRQMQVVVGTQTWREEALKLQESRFKGGLANEMDVARARTELELARNDLAALERQRGNAENALAVICGEIPSDFHISKVTSQPRPPKVPGGLPSSLLQRRPDIRAAEQKMREANAKVGVSKASFYPAFSIVGSGGLESIGAENFYDQRSRILSIGPSMTLPIFQGGKLRANLRASKANYDETLANYRQSILVALQEVEDSLLDARAYAKQGRALDAAIASAQETQRLAELRYQKGLASYFEVVDANRTVLNAKLLSAQIEGQRLMASVAMLKALGGGW
ncbi:MAG: efflux transporter outer membrane subunit [Prosthecobacter sp.]|uniref:efflux transporter outer membrane subunit n=1 Tax=Prosthecobacter sp. TaxID=1965333 RepID=UPI0025CBAD9C|nr:efflux transporter outer membrane subunit [Prosthecobacter sp.]MCF7787450.1 efflux transporter outer membrane subunit [Prosthecobacter sp.]